MSFASDKYETVADAYEAGYRAADATGSLALAACEAREAKWTTLAKYMADGVCDCEEQIEGACAACFARALLSAPRDSEALAAFGEKVALAVMDDDRIDYRGDDEDAPVCVAAAIVARILSGGANG